MSEDRLQVIRALVVRREEGLTIHNPKILTLATRWGWKPQTLLAHIKRDLPSVVEREIYLEIGLENRLRPSTLGKLLRGYLGERELQVHDLIDNNGLIEQVQAFLMQTIVFLEKTSVEYGDINFSTNTVIEFVNAYGQDAETIMASVMSNLSELAEHFNIANRSTSQQVSILLHIFAKEIKCRVEQGNMIAVTFEDLLAGATCADLRDAVLRDLTDSERDRDVYSIDNWRTFEEKISRGK